MAQLDSIDRQILKELQDDGRITNVELARRVGISAPPCLRRVRALEEAGYIKGYRALLDEKLLGYEVTVFAMVHLTSQAEADLKAFEDFVRAQPLVRECWMLSGEIDFILKCVAPDLKTFQAFVAELTAAPHVRNVKTSLTLRNSKDAAMVPLELEPLIFSPERGTVDCAKRVGGGPATNSEYAREAGPSPGASKPSSRQRSDAYGCHPPFRLGEGKTGAKTRYRHSTFLTS